MADSLAHRGPDGSGFFREQGIGLAHRRLSIIDLEGGEQPMSNEDQTVHVVFNGEIYNFRRLRRDLESAGHTFRTGSDTEVLVHMYEDYGAGLVDHLRGMFAFAIWDAPRRRLLLARDRVGQKPLYIYQDSKQLIFASELKAILSCNVDRQIDPEALDAYLAYGFVPGERSIFRNMRKLAAGSVLTVSADGFSQQSRRYWTFQPRPDYHLSVNEWIDAVAEKITETVDAHLVADVEVGAFLSGGVDSSAMVAIQSELSDQRIRTFSIGFRERQFSELPFAGQIARHFGTDHHEAVVTPDAVAGLEDLTTIFDEPFADSSAIPTMHLARLAREHVKVVISGDGGDEAFGGYSRYGHDLREAAIRRRLPVWLRRYVLRAAANIWPQADWLPRCFRAQTALTNLSLAPDFAYANTVAICRLPLRRRLLHGDLAATLNGFRPESGIVDGFRRGTPEDDLSGMVAADVAVLLPDDFLTKVDRASMACGLEVRPPLVDHELLELAGTIPSELKLCDGETKWILKRVFEHQLPAEIRQRSKQGFEIPVDAWLRGPLRDIFEEQVLAPASRVSQLIDQSTVRKTYHSHLRRTGRSGNVLWSLLVLSCWAERYLAPPQLLTSHVTPFTV